MTRVRASISVIVPMLDEAEEIAATLATTRDPEVLEVVVVDGGSRDRSAALAAQLADRVLTAPRGRAAQMNAGAAVARGSVLLFLHADTRLPPGFGGTVRRAVDGGAVGGRFDVELRSSHPLLRVVAALMNLRSRLTGISTGDQAIFVRQSIFAALGGFPSIPLMEDVAFSRLLRRTGRLAALREKVSTSGRRWETNGVARTILLMWWLRLGFACGVAPERLAELYRPKGEPDGRR